MSFNLFDRTLKIIARNHAATFLRLAFPNHQVNLMGTLENVEISLSVKPVDFVHQVSYNGKLYLFHLEFQTHDKSGLPRRTFITSAELTDQFKLPVLTLFIYLRPQAKAIPHRYRTQLGKLTINEFTYPVIKLWDFIKEIRSGQLRELAPLLPLLVAQPNESLLVEERNLILVEADDQKRADLLAAAVAIGSLFFDKQFLWHFFREEVNQMKQATFIDDWITEGIERGIQQGLQQGMERGLQQGLQQGMERGLQQGLQQGMERGLQQGIERGLQQGVQQGLELVRETLTDTLMIRFNRLPKQFIKQIKSINDPILLKTLHHQAMTAQSLADFEQLLTESLDDETIVPPAIADSMEHRHD